MNTEENTHVPFAELSIVDRYLYFFAATVAIRCLRPWVPTWEEIRDDMRRIWDEQKYTPADTTDFPELSRRLRPHLAKYAVKDPLAQSPELPSQRQRSQK